MVSVLDRDDVIALEPIAGGEAEATSARTVAGRRARGASTANSAAPSMFPRFSSAASAIPRSSGSAICAARSRQQDSSLATEG